MLMVEVQWHILLVDLNENNFKKLIVDYYSIFAEKYKLNPQSGWKDAFEETFGLHWKIFIWNLMHL